MCAVSLTPTMNELLREAIYRPLDRRYQLRARGPEQVAVRGLERRGLVTYQRGAWLLTGTGEAVRRRLVAALARNKAQQAAAR